MYPLAAAFVELFINLHFIVMAHSIQVCSDNKFIK